MLEQAKESEFHGRLLIREFEWKIESVESDIYFWSHCFPDFL